MTATDVLDTVERLLRAAGHPDMSGFRRYDGAHSGLEVTYASGARASLSVGIGKTRPAQLPEQMPAYKFRAVHLLALVVELLDQVQPAGWRWRLVEVEGVHLAPSALEVNVGGQTTLLQVTSTGAPGIDTDAVSFADWRIPADLAI